MAMTRREVLFACSAAVLGARWLGASSEPWKFRIAPAGEPGELILISGTIFQSDGVTPAAGARIFLYHTDNTGYYANVSGEPIRITRIKAFATASPEGRYEFRTIKPGQYPTRPDPAHIHVHLGPPKLVDRELLDYRWSVPSFLFEGDSRIPAAELETALRRGRFSPVVRLVPGNDGYRIGTRDLRMGEKES